MHRAVRPAPTQPVHAPMRRTPPPRRALVPRTRPPHHGPHVPMLPTVCHPGTRHCRLPEVPPPHRPLEARPDPALQSTKQRRIIGPLTKGAKNEGLPKNTRSRTTRRRSRRRRPTHDRHTDYPQNHTAAHPRIRSHFGGLSFGLITAGIGTGPCTSASI